MKVIAIACAECGKHVPVDELVRLPIKEEKDRGGKVVAQILQSGCKQCAEKLAKAQ